MDGLLQIASQEHTPSGKPAYMRGRDGRRQAAFFSYPDITQGPSKAAWYKLC